MSWLLEDPTILVIAVATLELLLAVVFLETGQAKLLIPMALLLVLGSAGVALERWVTTEREQVEDVLGQLVLALEANDVPRVVSFIAPEGGEMRQRAEEALARGEVQDAKFSDLDVSFGDGQPPAEARAEFLGKFLVHDRWGEIPYQLYIRRFALHMRRDGDQWLLTDYEVGDPRGGPMVRAAY